MSLLRFIYTKGISSNLQLLEVVETPFPSEEALHGVPHLPFKGEELEPRINPPTIPIGEEAPTICKTAQLPQPLKKANEVPTITNLVQEVGEILIPPGSDLSFPGRLAHNLTSWDFASPMTRKIISKGLTWKWLGKPPKLTLPPPSTCNGNVAPHLERLLKEGIIAQAPFLPCFTSRLFLVPKTSGGHRVVIDLFSLNKHIQCPTFKMMDTSKIRNSIPKNSLFTSIDISEAFHHIPIQPRFRKFLSFSFQNQAYHFQVMPFGINIGPRIFTKVITEVLKNLHTLHIRASVYIDDWLLWHQTESQLILNTKFTVNLLTKLGFTVNIAKSQLEPVSEITYLGVTWDGSTHTIRPSFTNINKVLKLLPLTLSQHQIRKKEYQKILGSLNFLAPFIMKGKLHLRLTILHSPTFKKINSALMSPEFRRQLKWWAIPENLKKASPISIAPPQMTIWSDASTTGWGGVCSQGHTVWGTWSSTETTCHINALECLAVLYCLQTLKPSPNCTILIRTDNSVVVSLINNQGSNKSSYLNKVLQRILNLCDQNQWNLIARHIPGHLNSWADSLSRNHPVKSEWTITEASFWKISAQIHPQIDLFAHPGNAKLQKFGCLFPHPMATVIDAMSANWNQWEVLYLFPPTDLIQTCLKKLQHFQGEGIFIAPHLPSAPWWPVFTERCELLEEEIGVFQIVQGEIIWATEKTSLLFRAYYFSRKSSQRNTRNQ